MPVDEVVSVFGGTGFIGSNYCRSYPQKAYRVPRVQANPISNRVLWFISTTDNYNVFTDLSRDVDTNLVTLMRTLEFCRNTDVEFNFVSSWFVYGHPNQLPVAEDHPCDPRGFYSITKRAAEQLLVSFCETVGCRYRILRLGNVYGRGDAGANKRKNAIQHMVQQIATNQPVDLYDGGTGRRDLIHVRDVVRAIDLVIEDGDTNAIYNIGSGVGTPVRHVINTAINLSGSISNVRSIPAPKFHQQVQTPDFFLDVSRLRGLGFEQEISLEQGIKELLVR